MPVEARIIHSTLPSEVSPDKEFSWDIEIETVGDGEDYIGGAMFKRPVSPGDRNLNRMTFFLVDAATGEPVKVPPGVRAGGSISVPPLEDWYTAEIGEPIPDTLEWQAIVGRLEITDTAWNLYGTDSVDHTVSVKKAVGIIEWIKAHPMELAAASGGLMIGVALLAKR